MSSADVVPTALRTIVYVDGFNLYFGLVAQGWRKYLWLNLSDFATSILIPNERLVKVKYFTSRITGPPDKLQRQNAYLTALRTLPDVQIITGRYQSDPVTCEDCGVQVKCQKCGTLRYDNNEKMTDVNIATNLFEDAFTNRFDNAILVTGDADQKPVVQRVRNLFGKCVRVCFPPKRQSYDLKNVANESFSANEESYRKSQFPNVVDLPGGHTVVKPTKWMQK